jgi:Abortive infection C-terminus
MLVAMRIKLWSRKEGIVRPPAQLVHAEPGSTSFPATFRTRVFRWSRDAMQHLEYGAPMGEVVNDARHSMEQLYQDLCSAYGREMLVAYTDAAQRPDLRTAEQQLPHHLDMCPDLEVMDYIDAVFQTSASIVVESGVSDADEAQWLGAGINGICEEEGVGYRWIDGRLVRFDEQIVHTQAMLPALAALSTGRFGAAEGEFDEAVADFGRGAFRDTLTNANAAFESVLQVVTGKKGTAGELIAEARRQGLIPKYLGASVENLEKLMHGLPATRGQQGSSHGLGTAPIEADERLARLVLTIAAALITFLADDGS